MTIHFRKVKQILRDKRSAERDTDALVDAIRLQEEEWESRRGGTQGKG